MKLGFDGGIKIEFHGAKLSSNGGLLAYRDLDHALGLFDSEAQRKIAEHFGRKNCTWFAENIMGLPSLSRKGGGKPVK